MDEFEQFLKKQPWREVPPTWRREILSTLPEPKVARSWWHEWLWPSPVAWAGLAVAWVLIFGLHLAAGPAAEQTAKETPTVSANMAAAFADQRRLLAELSSSPASEPPHRRSAPGPRSEIRVVTTEA